MNQKEKIEAFKASCRVYLNEKEALESYRSTNLGDRFMYQMMEDDVDFVEEIFDTIEYECGTQARLLFYLLYVKAESQVEVAKKFGLTRRQLQQSIYRWQRKVFPDDE
ncbi:MAG: helix-turn-helix domain-containing protein [Bulleidia sp.]